MKSLIYISRACQPLTFQEINELAASSSVANASKEITGFLCFQNNTFVQYIEGEARSIDELFSKISSDPRHKIINAIDIDADKNRKFPAWNMKYIAPDHVKLPGIEPFIFNLMNLMKNSDVNGEEWRDMIWRGVEVLANDTKALDTVT